MTLTTPVDRGKPGKKASNIPATPAQSKYSLRSNTSKSDPHGEQLPTLISPIPSQSNATVHLTIPKPSALAGNPCDTNCGACYSKGFAHETNTNHQASPVSGVAGDGSEFVHRADDDSLDKDYFAGQEDGSNNSESELQAPNSPQVQERKTYASIFKDSENIRKKGTLRFIAPKVTETGTRLAIIPTELIVKEAESWSNTLVGYFIGKRPAFPFVKFHANRLWKRFDLDDVILNDQGYFYFKFKTEQGLNHVFESGPWLFNDTPVLIKKWQPDVWFDKPVPTKVPIWVNIYDMPVKLWNYEILSHIVSTIGIPIAVDRYTAELCEKKTGRAIFARVLVEINSEQEVPRFVEAEIMKVIRRFRLGFNWLPSRCSHCKIFGHTFFDCSVRPRTVDETKTSMDNASKLDEVCPSGAKDDDFQQPRRRRRSKKAQSTISMSKVPQLGIPKDKANTTFLETTTPPESSSLAKDPPPVTTTPNTQSSILAPVHLGIPTSPYPDVDADSVNPIVGADTVATEPMSCSSRPNYIGTSTNAKSYSDSDKIWSYKDPTGKTQGPFSLAQLLEWSEQGCFPNDHKIWSISRTETESMFLHHVLKEQAKVTSATNGSDYQKSGGSLNFSDGG